MRILVSGSHGLVASALLPTLGTAGHTTVRLVRGSAGPGEAGMDTSGGLDRGALEGADAVVHLAGENIAGRWTAEKKARIRDSRVEGTRALVGALSRLERRPRVLVCASAVGYYGDRGDELLSEQSRPGNDFLAQVCQEWESAAEAATQAGIRAVELRIGLILSPKGGALAQMLPPFRLGAGGRMGSGRQYWSWVSMDDVVAAIQHAIATDSLRGPVNLVAPQPVRNAEFARTLGEVLHRPALFPMPAFMVRALLGEMGTTLLLGSQRVSPAKLEASGFRFGHPQLKPALEYLLQRAA